MTFKYSLIIGRNGNAVRHRDERKKGYLFTVNERAWVENGRTNRFENTEMFWRFSLLFSAQFYLLFQTPGISFPNGQWLSAPHIPFNVWPFLQFRPDDFSLPALDKA